jgi:predicted nucleotidyltransferase
MPPMSAAQERAWRALFELCARLGPSWCLVGGQMVHLYCAERGFTPNRPTEDADTVLDVRARPDILDRFTRALIEMGWTSAGESLESHQHRWINDRSQIDVLIPTNVGQTAAGRRGATGGTTLETRGGQQALDRAELVTVEVADEVGQVPRPNMAGALVIKAAAWTNHQDRYRDRHLTDFALLAAMVQRSDALATAFRPHDVKYLLPTLAGLAARPEVVASIAGSDRGLDVLGRIVNGR